MTALAVVAVCVMALAAWVSIFVVIPSCARSFFRYRLWRLRDLVTDEIREGAYLDKHQPRLLVKEIDAGIFLGSQLSLFRLTLAALNWRNLEPHDEEEWFDLSAANAADSDRLRERSNELHYAFAKFMVLGSPSGWLFGAVMFPLALTVTLWTTFSDSSSVPARDVQVRRGELRRRLAVIRLAVSDVFLQARSRVRDEVPFEPETALARLLGQQIDRPSHAGYA